MIDWEDTAIVLGQRKHAENDVIVSVLTREHGRHSGLVKGGASRRLRGLLQPGTNIHVRWRARLEDHLGNYTCELQTAVPPDVLSSAGRLAALVSACGLLELVLPEREVHTALYDLCESMFIRLAYDDWAASYCDFERGLLESLGFGLQLEACVATGVTVGLKYVSPKSGCAVSADAGAPYHNRMLLFPEIFRRVDAGNVTDVVAGLFVTGYFLQQHVLDLLGKPFPEARERLINRLNRCAQSGTKMTVLGGKE